jgi:outer membrane protein TolC
MAKEIAEIITDIKNLENLIASEKKAIEFAQEFYNHTQESFALNTVTLSSVLEAQYKLFFAKNNLNQLNYTYRLDHAKLMKTIGEIPLTDFQ